MLLSKSHNNPNYIHHQDNGKNESTLRELVFGMEDGMVSTLGSITGIAVTTQDPFITLLAGLVIVGVESISMGVGSYLSTKSVQAVDIRKLMEEKEEIKEFPKEEEDELVGMYVTEGWSLPLAKKMAAEAAKNNELFLREMAYRELKIIPDQFEDPKKNGIVMLLSYIVGGTIPLAPFFILPIFVALAVSIGITLAGLFLLGVYSASFSKRNWFRAGAEMFLLASLAATVGIIVGQVVERGLISS